MERTDWLGMSVHRLLHINGPESCSTQLPSVRFLNQRVENSTFSKEDIKERETITLILNLHTRE